MTMPETFVLDVTMSERDLPPVFCPYERESGIVITGMMICTDRCPGDLVGVFHSGGREAVEKWIKDHPDWREKYGKKEERQ